MQKSYRSIAVYIVLNCLTLGIYGFIVNRKIGKDINNICANDGQKPGMGYGYVILLRAIMPIFGLIIGFIFGLVAYCGNPGFGFIKFVNNFDWLWYDLIQKPLEWFFTDLFGLYLKEWSLGATKFYGVITFSIAFGLFFAVIGYFTTSIVRYVWCYKNAERFKRAASQYGVSVKDGGSNDLLYRTALEIALSPASALLLLLGMFAPIVFGFIIYACTRSVMGIAIATFIIFISSVINFVFGADMRCGSILATVPYFKNIPLCYGDYGPVPTPIPPSPPIPPIPPIDPPVPSGSLIGVKGTYAGYTFKIHHGEEIVVGKDARESSVVIDPIYKEVSRKHFSVSYDADRGLYKVVDYSSNGTWSNSEKLIRGQAAYLLSGSEIKLANGKNSFRLG